MITIRDEALKALRAGPVVLRRLVRDLTDEQLRTRPRDDEWAIVEVVAHLGDTDERTLARIRRMLVEDEPSLEPYDPAALAVERNYIAMNFEEQLERLASLRAEHVGLLESLDDADWARVGYHGEHGRVTVEGLTLHTAGEDSDHLAQIARMIPISL